MTWGAVAGTAISVVGGYLSKRSANKGARRGADAQAEANRLAIEEQRRQFDLTRQDMAPWLQAGSDALGRQTAFLDGDWSGFKDSPDYKWAFDQGMRSLDRSAAAQGRLYGGGTDLDRIGFGQGLALQNANSYWGKLAGLSGTGQQTAGQLGSFGMGAASNIGSLLNNTGAARRSSYQQQGDNNAGFWGGTFGAINNLGQNKGWWG